MIVRLPLVWGQPKRVFFKGNFIVDVVNRVIKVLFYFLFEAT